MLFRGANAVGCYLIMSSVNLSDAATSGIDVFRIFDSLNWLKSIEVALDEVLNCGKLAEVAICYTGDILDDSRDNAPYMLCKQSQEVEKWVLI